MEWLTGIVAGLLTLLGSAGLIIDGLIASQIRQQTHAVEKLAVRVDNTPNYQILQGKVDKVRLDGRGIYPLPDLRIDTLAVETDALDVDLKRLQGKGNRRFSQALRQNAQGAVKLVLREDDINRALATEKVRGLAESTLNRLLPREDNTAVRTIKILGTSLNFLPQNRIQLEIKLEQQEEGKSPEPLEVGIESGFRTDNGRNVQIIEPVARLNGKKISPRLVRGFAEGIGEQLDLGRWEKDRIFLRILQLEIEEDKVTLAAFVRISPDSGNSQ
jgi:hypothetical protein